MENYQGARANLTITQLNKLNPVEKNKTETILRIKKKHFQDEELSQKILLTTRKTTKIINAIAKNMSTDIKLCKAQLSKIIQLDGFLHNMLCNLGEKVKTDLAIPLARDNLPQIVINLASNAIKKSKRKINWKGTVGAGKELILFISN